MASLLAHLHVRLWFATMLCDKKTYIPMVVSDPPQQAPLLRHLPPRLLQHLGPQRCPQQSLSLQRRGLRGAEDTAVYMSDGCMLHHGRNNCMQMLTVISKISQQFNNVCHYQGMWSELLMDFCQYHPAVTGYY